MVNNVFNKLTPPSVMPTKTPQGTSNPGAFQELFASLHNFDLTSTKAVPDTKSFQTERASVKEKPEAQNSQQERDIRETRQQEKAAREISEKKENAKSARTDRSDKAEKADKTSKIDTANAMNTSQSIDASQTQTEEALQQSGGEKPQASQHLETKTMTEAKADPNAPKTPSKLENGLSKEADVVEEASLTPVQANEAAVKAQTTEAAAQPVTVEAVNKAEVQQGQATAVNVLDTGAKRTVNLQQNAEQATVKVDEKALQNMEEGGKQNFEGDGSNQQKTSEEGTQKLANSQNNLQSQLQNVLKQPSFKESVDRAMKAEVKASEAVGNQTSQDSTKSSELKIKTDANIERPKQAAKFAESVGHGLRNMKFNPGKNEMTIRIDPPQLGKLKISVNLEQGKISTSIVAESHTVKQALENNMHLLKGSLEQNGLKLDNLTVTVDQGSRENANLAFGERRNQNGGQTETGKTPNTVRNLDESEIEQYTSLNNYRAESKGVYFVSTTA